MIKYLPLLLLISCGSNMERIEVNQASNTAYDSLTTALDSLKTGLVALSSVADFAKGANEKIRQLEKERDLARVQRDREISYTVSDYTQYKVDDRDKKIAELTRKLYLYETEIASLKRKMFYDSMFSARTDQIPNKEFQPEKPNDHSLVVVLDRKMKDNTEIPLTGIDVYIIPYSKKVKGLMKYEINCDVSKLEDATQAGFYNGQYFFNNVTPGKYLIKICAYYGGYKVIERENNYQSVAMQVSPPIQ